MLENVPDHRHVFNKADDAHDALTFRTNQKINLIYLLNQSCPAFSESLHIPHRFENARYGIVFFRFFSFSARDIAVIAIVPDHLLAPVRDVRTHCRQPFHSGKIFVCPAIFGCIANLSLLFQISHPILRKRCPNDIKRQILHSGFIFRCNSVAAEDMEAGMFPSGEHPNHFFGDLALL